MASFIRPDSPPPRQPSPDILPTPLPHPRRAPSQPRIRVQSPHGLRRNIHAVRSMDLANERGKFAFEDGDNFNSPVSRARQRTTSTHTSRSSPRCSPSPCNRDYLPGSESHKRTLSVAIPSPVPSPTPTMVSSWPPAPSVKPSPYVTNGIACPKPVSLKPIVFDQPDGLGITERSSPGLHQKSSRSSLKVPPLEKHRNMGIACLRFFGIKPQSKQPPTDAVTL